MRLCGTLTSVRSLRFLSTPSSKSITPEASFLLPRVPSRTFRSPLTPPVLAYSPTEVLEEDEMLTSLPSSLLSTVIPVRERSMVVLPQSSCTLPPETMPMALPRAE